MIWRIEGNKKVCYLSGTAHFFPYSFKDSLRQYIKNVDTVLLEGPLDEDSMRRVVDFGVKGEEPFSLYDILDMETINKIKREISPPLPPLSSFVSYRDILVKGGGDLDYLQIKGLRPWMAFFSIWFRFLERYGWRYKMDIDAMEIGHQMGKEIYFLERIEEQIDALNGIPIERIVNFLKKMEDWKRYTKHYVKHYLKGDIDGIMSVAEEFPTRCESIIDKRDPILYERMKPFIEKGNTIAFVGITHIYGIRKMLLKDGYGLVQLP